MISDIGLGGGRRVRTLVLGFGGMRLLGRISISMGGEAGHYISVPLSSILER